MFIETAVVRLSMPGGVGGQRREPLPTRLEKRFQCELFRVADTVFTFQNLYEVFSKMFKLCFLQYQMPYGQDGN